MKDSFIALVPLDLINENPYQVRKEIPHDHIGNLASDIRAQGLLENPAGRAVDKDGNPIPWSEGCEIQLAYGHCRHQAFYLLDGMYADQGYDKLPVKIVEYTDEEMALAAWSENETRKQLNPVERALTFQQWINRFGWTQAMIAEKVRLERSTVANLLRLLSLPAGLLTAISDGSVSQRQATAMIPFYELSQSEQDQLCANKDFDDFFSAAWMGQVNSDTIRERINAAIAEIHPAPAQFDFTVPNEAPIVVEAGDEVLAVPDPEYGEEQAWLQKDIEGNDVVPEPVQPVEEPEPAKEPAPIIPANQPALPTAPVPAPMAQQPAAAPVTEMPAAPATPKTWAESQYTVTLGFQPEDGHEMGRQVFISTRRNDGSPNFLVARIGAWKWNMPWQLEKLINDLHPEDFEVEA
ncbi:hypothetical protein hrd7_25090 [Leptolinea sp. HRD-7]|nr:hypothetical protein hrd7_25090 [Leptolinea sp. HRD-7]